MGLVPSAAYKYDIVQNEYNIFILNMKIVTFLLRVGAINGDVFVKDIPIIPSLSACIEYQPAIP